MADLTRPYSDWKAKSLGDLSAFAGLGGGIKHLSIWSPALKKGAHAVVIFAGVGGEIDFKKIKNALDASHDFLKSYISNHAKFLEGTYKGAQGLKGYESLKIIRAFSLSDFALSTIAQAEASAAVVGGVKAEALTAFCGSKAIFAIPPGIGVAWGLGAGAQVSVGFIAPLKIDGFQFLSLSESQVYIEKQYREKPTDLFIGSKL